MSDPEDAASGDEAREAAERIAEQVSPLVKLAQASGFDFLAYLLGMALKESRRLAEDGDKP